MKMKLLGLALLGGLGMTQAAAAQEFDEGWRCRCISHRHPFLLNQWVTTVEFAATSVAA